MTQALLPGMPAPDFGGDLDHYQTPHWATRAVLPYIPPRVARPGGCILIEPAAGRGAILEVALPAIQPLAWSAFEIDAGRCSDLELLRLRQGQHNGSIHRCDFLTDPIAEFAWASATEMPLLFFGNPPYGKKENPLATPFVEKCLRIADAPTAKDKKGVVAMLLQHDFATGVDRCERIHDYWKSSMYPLKRRPGFGGKHSSGERPFSWFVFDLGYPDSEWRPIG